MLIFVPDSNFDLKALYEALDEKRQAENLTWSAVARQVARDHKEAHAVAATTMTRLKDKRVGEGDGILQMLLWLGRAPESFLPGFIGADTEHFRLPMPAAGESLRWDTKAIYAALNIKREQRGMTWKAVALEIGGCTAGMLTHLSEGGRTGLPHVMRLVRWLDRPAAVFTVCAPDTVIFGPGGVRSR
ncbi:MAG: hypothetical protein QM758_29530 [Armatimonas sp.]